MVKRLWLQTLLLLFGLLLPFDLYAYESAYGVCELGNRTVAIGNLTSTTKVQQSFPSCTVTVYVHGASPTTLATIYSDNANPPTPIPGGSFTANSNGSWQFYAPNGSYDIVMSGAGFPSPFTIFDVRLSESFYITDFGTKCDGVTNSAAAFTSASAFIQSAGGGSLVIPSDKTCIIGTNTTLASGVVLNPEPGAGVSVSGGITMTLNGPFVGTNGTAFVGSGTLVINNTFTAPHTSMFGSSLTVSFGVNKGKQSQFNAAWWGIAGDDSTNNSTLVPVAINSLPSSGGQLIFGEGTFRYPTTTTFSKAGVALVGSGVRSTIFDCHASVAGVTMINATAINDFSMSNIGLTNTGSTACARGIFTDGDKDIQFTSIHNIDYTQGFTTAALQCGADSDNAIGCHIHDWKSYPHDTSNVNARDIWLANCTGCTVDEPYNQDANIGIDIGTSASASEVDIKNPYCAITTNLTAVCAQITWANKFTYNGGSQITRNQNNRIVKIVRAVGGEIRGGHTYGSGQMDYAYDVTGGSNVKHVSFSSNVAESLNQYMIRCSAGAQIALYDNATPTPTKGVEDPTGQCSLPIQTVTTGTVNLDTSMLTMNGVHVMTLNISTNGPIIVSLSNGSTPAAGQELTVVVKNISGGAAGGTTWDGNFRLAGAWVDPANGKNRSILFAYDAVSGRYYEITRTAADVTN